MNAEPIRPAADAAVASATARRLAPAIAAVSLVVMLAMLAWMAMPPSGIVGPIADAPFTIDAMLVTSPDRNGCVDVVDGTGAAHELCVDVDSASEAFFTSEGDLLIGSYEGYLRVDADTGAVLEEVAGGSVDDRGRWPDPLGPGASYVWTDGDAVYLETAADTDGAIGEDEDRMDGPKPDVARTEDREPLLELDGPPEYQLSDAQLSPDGRYVVVVDRANRVMIAPVDGSAGVHLWYRGDTWVSLYGGVRWG